MSGVVEQLTSCLAGWARRRLATVLALGLLGGAAGTSLATETENLGIRILPVPHPAGAAAGQVVIDGKAGDWDLSGGIFVCGDVENLRDKLGVWLHVMYDADNLYVLARWLDETPLSNPGLVGADSPWRGDSLQLRIIADPERLVGTGPKQRPPVCWANGWYDRAGKAAVDINFPYTGGEVLPDALAKGARLACLANADKKGYVQEMALPWALLIAGGITPHPGGRIVLSVEPNFNTTAGFRVSLKDLFRPGVVPDRVFTFSGYGCWGYATFAPTGPVVPQPLRLADNRELPVTLHDGVPVVDWSGLFTTRQVEGFAPLTLDLPEDGYVSLNIKNADGRVVRHLLNASFMTKGTHELRWDGLTNLSHLRPGEVVAAGEYHWEAIYHTGIGLRLVGWANNAGKTPFDSPGGNWGGDFGAPCTLATDGQAMYLGWQGSEAGKAVVCTDFAGNVKWRHKRGGFGQAVHLAVAGGIVYVNDNQVNESVLYRLDAKKGEFSYWKGKDTAILPIAPKLQGLEAANGKLYLSQADGVHVLDAATGEPVAQIAVAQPSDLAVAGDGTVYVLSAGQRLLRLTADGGTQPVVEGLTNAAGLAIGPDGAFYIGVGEPDHQVKVFDAAGKPTRTIGKPGGRPLLGLWDAAGMRFITALRVDAKGLLWVAECDWTPKRISCWNTADGSFVREFFGPTGYGAPGGAISPDDPLTMVGSGCEWRLDEQTGKATVVGVFHREGMANSRFGRGPDGRLYVGIATGWYGGDYKPVLIYERTGPGVYKLRTTLSAVYGEKTVRGKPSRTNTGVRVWSDANDDQQEQPEEVRSYEIELGMWLAGWYMPMTPTLIFYGGNYRVAPTGWTACGAPLYDLAQATLLPGQEDAEGRGIGMGASRSCGSADGRLVVYNGRYGQDHSDFACYELPTGAGPGKLRWSYPNNYVGVHGGHKAPPPQAGMIRGAYDIVGTGKLPDPIGDIFAIGTDKGEWHILTGAGFYLTRLFEGDALKIRWPDPVVPGAIMDNTPPGMGAEDFGGSITVAKDGQLYVQAGKTAYINMKVVGLDTVKALPGGKLTVSQADLALATACRDKLLQAATPIRVASAKARSVTFTGDLLQDFATKEPLAFQKSAADHVDAAIAYDATTLYLGWVVKDATPWLNGASDPMQMYAMGDTVDFQLGTDPQAKPQREQPVLGDLRLSVGNLKGQPTAVLYRPLATDKAPQKFFSGTVKEGYEMQSVKVLADARIAVKVDAVGKRYVVEVAIPLAALGLTPAAGVTVSGDFGATFGDAAGTDTVLRSYWSNQATGLVADEVWELKLEPKNWGKISFE